MALFFGKARAGSAVVIDIGSASVGGAYAAFPKNQTPLVPFSTRVPIAFMREEEPALSMLRALDALTRTLFANGRPALMRAAGIERPDRIYVSVSSRWQETRVDTEVTDGGKPFVFTRGLLRSIVAKGQTPAEKGAKELQREVMAVLLNGYETADPFGKRAERAEVIILSSTMDGEVMSLAARAAKRFGAKDGVLLAPFQSLAYAVLRAQYPHDKDFLLVRVSGEATNILLANRGLVMDVASVPVGLPGEGMAAKSDLASRNAWVARVTDTFREFATKHALPRLVFLVADEASTESLKRLFDTPDMHGLWLSDEPLAVIPVVSRLLSSLIRHHDQAGADVMLDLIVLFAQLRAATA